MPRMKLTARWRRAQEEPQEADDHEKCRVLDGVQVKSYRLNETPDLEDTEKYSGRYNNSRQCDAAWRTEVSNMAALDLTLERVEGAHEECRTPAETVMKKRKVEEIQEKLEKCSASKKVHTGVPQAEDQTDDQLTELDHQISQQDVPKDTDEKELKCFAQDTMNELLGMFGYDGVDEKEARSLHVSSSFVPPPPPPVPQRLPTQKQEPGMAPLPGCCTLCKKTFKGAALDFVLKLNDETQAFCSADCLRIGKAANVSNASRSNRSQTVSNETEKKLKCYAQDTMNEQMGMYRYDGFDQDATSNLQISSSVEQTPSSSTPHHGPSPSQEKKTTPDTRKCCMSCKVETAELDFVLKLPDGNLQAYCSGMCLTQGKALTKKMSTLSGAFRPSFSHYMYNHNKKKTSPAQDGNTVSHNKQCAGSRNQTKIENKQQSKALKFVGPLEEKNTVLATQECCVWCKNTSAALDFILKLPNGKLHAYCSAVCLSKGKASKSVQVGKNSNTSQSIGRPPNRCTQDKMSLTRNNSKVFYKDQGAESRNQSKRTKTTNSVVFWLCHCCKKTVPGDRVVTSNNEKFCSEVCVSKYQRRQ
ncbi:uncharacterized protein LOC144885640 isoform X2 [Branchiostoma floridae x Branchiostoma japonicum]